MTLVPINSTLNRVMIKELALSATLVAVLASLPYLFSPIQVAIGSFSDRHPVLGLKRSPYILLGLLLCVLGLVLAPQAAYTLAEDFWAGLLLGAAAFGAWGMGYNFASVSYLSLASELSGESGRGRTIAVMWFMMIASIIVTAIALSGMLEPYTPEALRSAFWNVALAALVLGLIGLVGLEKRVGRRESGEASVPVEEHSWGKLFRAVMENRQAALFFWYLIILLAAILGQDILLEPFGAEAFAMSVQTTTRITSIWGGCVLLAIVIAGFLEGRISKIRVAKIGGWSALIGFIMIGVSGAILSKGVFYGGVVLLGIGTGLSTVSNLSLMLDMTVAGNVGLFIGAWGMANAISRLIGTVLGGAARDIFAQHTQNPVLAYMVVFFIEAAMLALSLWLLGRIDVNAFHKGAKTPSVVERAALAAD
jgi:BCD family chlorophyll transporter-like MFS transporter